ncbi:hypothetical protein HAX54_029097 [Datura stramonium]|uniref:Uncharacterized protein n=1 Tax=Datura stramonium TaxID=4076 RepID=A0ABS8RKS6_DATST|nr:hypothetical protein [Datura stramonium]
MAIPALIIWQLWKRRNAIKHGEKMSLYKVVRVINRYVGLLAKSRYPWMQALPQQWTMMVTYLEEYTPTIMCRVVQWKNPRVGIGDTNRLTDHDKGAGGEVGGTVE